MGLARHSRRFIKRIVRLTLPWYVDEASSSRVAHRNYPGHFSDAQNTQNTHTSNYDDAHITEEARLILL